ncbi:low molecular weight protein-tyrosine-phosphatase [Blastomonas sp. AAP53]|uniref:low molecular weight protein-tyrosine-phosphatase n=1 Tax=Blastomonas sp. AAP53 TaxID=1248760 RepID=UPI000306C81A|nr:low molecular weight protein-tyrosine-phosphatase [Blastomonas sp. AAP53]
MTTPSILFVCLGNICRSPLADGALRHAVRQRDLGWTVDSAGTGGWHSGDAPDPRAIAVARQHGVDIAMLRARQVRAEDFTRFDLILAMDHDNLAGLRAMAPSHPRAELRLALDLVEGRAGQAVADPYYGDASGFEATWADASAIADGVLRHFDAAR